MRLIAPSKTAGLLLLSLAVAACQPTSSKPASSASSPAAAPSTSAASSSLKNGKWQSTGIFDDRLEAATHKMMANALETCMSGGGTDLMNCVSGELAQAIDPSGNAKSHCAQQTDPDSQFQCALAGTVIMKLRENNGVAMSDSAWSNFDKAMREELLAVGIHESFACAKLHGSEGPAFRQCMSAGVLTKLDVEPAAADPCLGLQPDEKFGQCVGEAGMISLLEAAAGRSI